MLLGLLARGSRAAAEYKGDLPQIAVADRSLGTPPGALIHGGFGDPIVLLTKRTSRPSHNPVMRARYGRGPGREAEAEEYLPYCVGRVNGCKNPHAGMAVRALQDIDSKHPSHELGPRVVACPAFSYLLWPEIGDGLCGTALGVRQRVGGFEIGRNNKGSPAGGRGQHPHGSVPS